ncbi:uncharacterized protein LOC123345822 [Mauremys mutica]|uniref:uncharacterized protein LOC123345822 n=1 Tax=Mauremys mutica TaxID=74926 RepID=UPI001D162127|nr:uncharacterized protein LOC123345822 [Mauremys mutica]
MGRPLAPTIICFIVFLIPSIAAGLGVQQLPPTASIPAGGSVTLSCTFHSRNQTGTKVTWVRGSPEAVMLDPAHPFYQGRLAQSQRDQQGRAEATVTLSELMERDSDLYHCYITHLQSEQEKGTGTTLTVMGRGAPGERELCWDSGPLFYRAVISLSLVVLFSLGITLSLRPWNGVLVDPAFSFAAITFIALVHEGLTVLQSPAVLRASPGETVTLNCSFENTQGSMAKASWTRAPGVVLDSAHLFYSGRLRMSHLDLLQKGEATLTLSELELRDSGLYQCHISIHQGESGTGAGTELQVMGRNQSDTDKVPAPSRSCARELLYQVTIALGLLLILGLAATLLLKRHRGTKPEPSPR